MLGKKKSEEVGSGSGGDCVKRNGWRCPVTVSNSVYTVYVWLLPIVMDYTRLLPCFGRLFSPSCCVSFLFLHGVITGIWQNDWDHSCPDTRYISYYIKKKFILYQKITSVHKSYDTMYVSYRKIIYIIRYIIIALKWDFLLNFILLFESNISC